MKNLVDSGGTAIPTKADQQARNRQGPRPAKRERYLATVRGGRVLPLIAMPIIDVGQGRFRGRRAEVVRELIRHLSEFVANHPIDVALCLQCTADFAAAQ